MPWSIVAQSKERAYAAARGLVLCDDITCSLRALSRLLACRVEPGELPAGAHQNDRSRSGHAWPGVPLLCRRFPDELTSIHRRPQQRPQRSSPRSRKTAFDGARLVLILGVLSLSLSWQVHKPSSYEPYRLCPIVAQLLVYSSHFLIQK